MQSDRSSSFQVIEGHSSPTRGVAFSSNGKLLASASDDKTIKLWDPITRLWRGTFQGHSEAVSGVAFSPDCQFLASASHDGTVRLWHIATGTLRRILAGHLGWAVAVAFSPDGEVLASVSHDRTAILWDPATGALRWILAGHSGSVTAAAFSPDCRVLASASNDCTIGFWDVATGALRRTITGHLGWVTAVSFSPDGEILASASHDKTVMLWDTTTGGLSRILSGHLGWLTALAFSPNGRFLASASHDETTRFWDPTTGVSRGILKGHSSEVTAVAFSPDSLFLASASLDTAVRILDVCSIEPVCPVCKDLKDDPTDEHPFHVTTIHEAIETAGEGCLTCALLLKGVYNHIGFSKGSTLMKIIFDRKGGPLEVGIKRKDEHDMEWFEFYTHIGNPSKWASIGPAREVSKDSSTDGCMEMAKQWLNECLQGHKDCPDTCESTLPTRVLHWDPDMSRLQLREPKGEKGRYAALSHCWGSVMPLTTTLTTLAERKVNIPFSALPQTFRDAVRVTQKLGINNLWIDSLCILQDSLMDWETEAGQMAGIYANAAVTIIADAAADSQGGCFVAGENRIQKGIVAFSDSTGDLNKVFVRRMSWPADIGHSAIKHKDSILSTRGWCLQERLLSPRVIAFGAAELGWECASRHCCECTINPQFVYAGSFRSQFSGFSGKFNMMRHHWGGVSGVEDPKFTHVVRELIAAVKLLGVKDRYGLGGLHRGEGRPGQLQQPEAKVASPNHITPLDLKWEPIIDYFTNLKFTFQKDRLPALSGLAAALQQSKSSRGVSDKYMFGLWRQDLVRGLLWSRVPKKDEHGIEIPNPRQPLGYAPSWSWASTTGNIHWSVTKDMQGQERSYALISIRDSRYILASTNKYGPGKGELDIRGVLAPVRVHASKPNGPLDKIHIQDNNSSSSGSRTLKYPGSPSWDVSHDACEVNENEQYYFLFVAKAKERTRQELSKTRVLAGRMMFCRIVLRRVEGKESTYSRLGSMIWPGRFGEDEWRGMGDEASLTIV